jgi:ABC-2 type transport system permease protein
LIGDEINTGNLSNYLLKPINYFLYYLSKDLGDKAMNIVFSIFEIGLIIFIFKPPLFFQRNPELLLFSFVSVVAALMIYFFFNILLGLVGFWSPEVWGPRFVFTIVVSFFAGSFFPLDILPKAAFNILSLTPFPYMIFFTIKIYLGTLPIIEIYKGLLISFSWVILSYLIVRSVWIKGLRAYTAQGR